CVNDQCPEATKPFTTDGTDTAIPTVALISVPVLATAALGVGFLKELLNRVRRSSRTARLMLTRGNQRTVMGYQVYVVDDEHAFAVALPARHGGITVSTAALSILDRDELAAV